MNDNADSHIIHYCRKVIHGAEDRWQAIPVHRSPGEKVEPIPLAAELKVPKDRQGPGSHKHLSFPSSQEAIARALGEGARVVTVAGEPGAGKTVSARWSARFFAKRAIEGLPALAQKDPEQGRAPGIMLPVYVDLGEWSTIYSELNTLPELLETAKDEDDLPRGDHKILWLLDGLDLLTGEGPKSPAAALSKAEAMARKNGDRFVFFSRPLATKDESHSGRGRSWQISLRPLDPGARTEWARKLYPRAEQKLADFEKQYPQHRSFLDVPLLFAMVLSACIGEEEFKCDCHPGRAGLFQGFVTYALGRAERDGRITRAQRDRFETWDIHVLAGVFWAALAAGHEDRVPRSEIRALMEKAFPEKAEEKQASWDNAAAVLQWAGLLLDLGNESAWGVLHQQFAEFLAARHLAERLKTAAKGGWFELELWDHLRFMRLDPVTAQALAILSTLPEVDGKDVLGRAFETLKEADLEHALEMLARTGTDFGWDRLVHLSDSKSIICAMRVMRRMGDHRAVPFIIDAIKRSDTEVRSVAALNLGLMNDPRTVNPLIEALKDSEEEVRYRAAYALGCLGNNLAVVPLIMALNDREPHVREFVVEALGEIKDSLAVAPIVNALKDPDWKVNNAAVRALGRIGDLTAVPMIAECLQNQEENVRFFAAHALGEMKDSSAVAPLIETLKDPRPMVRKASIHALAQIKDHAAVFEIIKALDDQDKDLRHESLLQKSPS